MTFICDACKHSFIIYNGKTGRESRDKRYFIKALREHLIVTNLFGCKKCTAHLKKLYKDLTADILYPEVVGEDIPEWIQKTSSPTKGLESFSDLKRGEK